MPVQLILVLVAVVAVALLVAVIVYKIRAAPKPLSRDEKTARAAATPLPPGVLDEIGRTAFRPVCEQRESPDPISKFNGCPWLPEGTEWPLCTSCGRPMQLFLQLDLDALPDGAPPPRGGGLVQVFYCVNSEDECEGDEAWLGDNDAAKLLRIISTDGPGATPTEDVSFDPQPPQTITGWERELDYPDMQDLDSHFPHLGEDVRERIVYDDDLITLMDDKLGGWPSWVQGDEWYDCPECGTRMELLFQIDSGGHTGHDFGDLGTAHLLRCPTHPSRMTFGWACH